MVNVVVADAQRPRVEILPDQGYVARRGEANPNEARTEDVAGQNSVEGEPGLTSSCKGCQRIELPHGCRQLAGEIARWMAAKLFRGKT